MPLPQEDITWPPVNMQHIYTKQAEWAAWYSGEPSRITAVYRMAQPANVGARPFWRFWSRADQGAAGAQRALIHVPIAGDLASTSAALLFGEPPTIRIRTARSQADEDAEDATGEATTPEELAEERLLQIIEEGGVHARLVEAAESAAAIGGVYIYPVWDKDLRDFPLMAVAQSDMAVPEFRMGILTAVTFHKTIQEQGSNRVLRLLERHEVEGTGPSRKAVVLSAVYQGTEDRLGVQVGLGAGDTVSANGAEIPARVELPFPDLDVEYIPNIKPNRLWRAEHIGVSDYQGAETLLDALDETYASWMRDIRLAKARILVPREYLRPDQDGAPAFDVDQEIYVGMDMEPTMSGDSRSMLAHQFAIRYLEHQETAQNLVERIVSNAGYSPGTLGVHNPKGDVGTGTALRISEHKTLLTLRRKSPWWRTAIANTLYRMMLIDREVFGQTYPAIRPVVDLSDSIIDNPLELAQTALALKTAESASVETRVRMVHPDWSGPEVDAEVDRIRGDAPAPAAPAFGNPAADPASTGNLPTTDQAPGTAPNHAPPPSPPLAKNA